MGEIFIFADQFEINNSCKEKLKKYGDIIEISHDNKKKLFNEVRRATILITEYTNIDKEVLNNAEKLKGIIVYGTGTNHIDLREAAERNIPVLNTPGANSEAVAEFTFSLILNLIRKTSDAINYVEKGNWQQVDSGKLSKYFKGIELKNRTLGILGYGNIGKKVARISRGFDMKVGVYDHNFKNNKDNIIYYNSLEELLINSNIISIHIPLNSKTKNLLNKNRLNLLSPEDYIINTSRGGIIDEDALVEMIKKGELSGAAFDVTENEPHVKKSLIKEKNILITPHIGGITNETINNISNSIIDAVISIRNKNYNYNLMNKNLLKKYGSLDKIS